MKIGLIGHSHSVCLMDALGTWRDQAGTIARATRKGYSNAFDGWDATDTSQKVIRLPACKIGRFTADLACVVISGASLDYSLVAAEANDGRGVTLHPTQTLARACEAFADCDLIVSIAFGNELIARIWIDDLPHYDFGEDSLPGPLREGAQPIDRKYIRQPLNEYVSRVLTTCLIMRRLCPRAGIGHVMPPPPLEDPSRVKHHEGFAEAMAKNGILDATLRLKWYRAYASTMKNVLNQGGIALVPPPPAAVNEKGFFREYLSNGLTHGNAQYGALLWEAIASSIGTPR